MIYFTADPHYRHEVIIKYCNRPFNNSLEMEKGFIKNWNLVVSKEDLTYIVGDFSMEGARNRWIYETILKKLNGRKILIPGNHDLDKIYYYAGDRGVGFEQVCYPYKEVEEFIVIHDPTAGIIFPNRPFITGHVHQQWHTMHNCFNCGVDVNNYTPVSIETIRTHFKGVGIL